jgi:uncharacterized protein (DUF433 family)
MASRAQEVEMKADDILSRDPEIVSGAVVFKGTRVPVEAFFQNIVAGVTIDEFLDDFPTVEREQVEGVLQLASDDLKHLFEKVAA